MSVSKELDEYLQKRRSIYGYRLKVKSKNKKEIKKVLDNVKETTKDFAEKFKEFFDNLKEKFVKREVIELNPEEVEEEIEEGDEEPKEEINDSNENMNEEEEKSPKKLRFWEIIKEIFKKRTENNEVIEEEYVEEIIELDYEELRQAFRIANSYLKKLPPAVIKAFKHSEDYRIYYKVMEKLGLVKKREKRNEFN